MATVLSLPPTKDKTSRLKQPADGGVWVPLPNLKDLASALDIEGDKPDRRDTTKVHELKSVPHTWGHILIFEAALMDPGCPGHSDAVSGWRALLAMLALRCEEGLALSVKQVDLGARNSSVRNPLHAFAEVVKEETPRHVAAGGDWVTLQLIHAGANGVLVGMLSPRTIVVPARSFSGSHELGHPWAWDGLDDPVASAEYLSAHQLMICSRFVGRLEKTLRDHADKLETTLAHTLAGLLQAFRSDLDGVAAGDILAEPEEQRRDLVTGNGLPVLYEAVNWVWQLPDRDRERTDSDATVFFSGRPDGRFGPFERVLLADPALEGTLDKPAARIHLMGTYMLSDFPHGFQRVQAKAAAQRILLLRPEDLLAQDLACVEGLNATEHPQGFESMLLPLTPVALLLWSVETLRSEAHDNCKPDEKLLSIVERDGGLDVTLQIQIKDRQGKVFSHRITHNYPRPDDKVRAPACLAAWPDFSAPDWRWNYLYGSPFNTLPNSRGRSAVLTTGVSRKILTEDLRSLDSAGPLKQWQRLQAWASGKSPWGTNAYSAAPDPLADSKWIETLQTYVPPADQVADARNEGHTKRLQRCDWPFEAALFATIPDTRYAGMGILPPAPLCSNSTREADVAIDFGTTNTVVYSRIGDDGPSPATFLPRLRRLNDLETGDDYIDFMPTAAVKQPFPTVMQERAFEGVNPATLNLGQAPLWRDFALFDSSVLRMTETILSEDTTVILGFKWADDALSRERVVRYLGHIVVMSLAEVAARIPLKNIRLRFSYPRTLPQLANAFSAVIEKHLTARVTTGAMENNLKPRFYTESDATLKYFREQNLPRTTAMLVLDIGGGSTDIALSIRDVRVWEHSVRLAGEHLMDTFLLYNRELLKDLQLHEVGQGSGVFGDTTSQKTFMKPKNPAKPTPAERDAAKAIINSNLFGQRFEERLLLVENAPHVRRLKAGAWLMVGGLFHFLDLQLRAFMTVCGLNSEQLETVLVCFAGRGSTLFKLLSHHEKSTFERLIRLPSLTAAALRHTFSAFPKHEAAQGMLASESMKDDLAVVEKVCGIRATIAGVPVSPEAPLHPELLEEILKPLPPLPPEQKERSSVDMKDFQTFLNRIGKTCGFEIHLDPVARTDISDRGNEELQKFIDGSPVDPPFLKMLQRTLCLLYDGTTVTVNWKDMPIVPRDDLSADATTSSGDANSSDDAKAGLLQRILGRD